MNTDHQNQLRHMLAYGGINDDGRHDRVPVYDSSGSGSGSDSDEREMMKVHPAMVAATPEADFDAEGADDFDLRQNYQNAVDCLVHCEFIMKSLQEQLRSKDDTVASLEARLVQAKLELAGAREVQDEQAAEIQRLRKRLRIDDVDAPDQVREASLRRTSRRGRLTGSQDISQAYQGQGQGQIKYAPIRNRKSKTESQDVQSLPRGRLPSPTSSSTADSDVNKRPTKLSRSSSQMEVMPWPDRDDEEQDDENDTSSRSWGRARTHPEPTRRGGFRLSLGLSQRMSWGINSDENTSGSGLEVNFLEDSSNRSGQNSNSNSSGKESFFSMFSGDAAASNAGSMPSDKIPASQGRQHRRQPSWSNTSVLDESLGSQQKRLSNLGQLFRNLKKNDAGHGLEGTQEPVKFDPTPSRTARRGASSQSLSIEGVVFPVSSDDCLLGLEKRIEGTASSGKKSKIEGSVSYTNGVGYGSMGGGRCSSGYHANAEW